MSPFYVDRVWNSELGRSEYVVRERHWFTLAKYLISIGAISKNGAVEYKNAGYTYNSLPMEERIKKSKRVGIMNDCFDRGFCDGMWSKTWANWLNEGFIYPRDGFRSYSTNRNFLCRTKYFEMAIGTRGYYLTDSGMRKYLRVLPNVERYKHEAEIRLGKKNEKIKKEMMAKRIEKINEEC